ncbi:MAG: hypothetical protein ABIF71_07200 [Planctomycetota bacterium]
MGRLAGLLHPATVLTGVNYALAAVVVAVGVTLIVRGFRGRSPGAWATLLRGLAGCGFFLGLLDLGLVLRAGLAGLNTGDILLAIDLAPAFTAAAGAFAAGLVPAVAGVAFWGLVHPAVFRSRLGRKTDGQAVMAGLVGAIFMLVPVYYVLDLISGASLLVAVTLGGAAIVSHAWRKARKLNPLGWLAVTLGGVCFPFSLLAAARGMRAWLADIRSVDLELMFKADTVFAESMTALMTGASDTLIFLAVGVTLYLITAHHDRRMEFNAPGLAVGAPPAGVIMAALVADGLMVGTPYLDRLVPVLFGLLGLAAAGLGGAAIVRQVRRTGGPADGPLVALPVLAAATIMAALFAFAGRMKVHGALGGAGDAEAGTGYALALPLMRADARLLLWGAAVALLFFAAFAAARLLAARRGGMDPSGAAAGGSTAQ